MKWFESYLCNEDCICPTILDRQVLRSAIHHRHAFELLSSQHLTHISMRLDSNDLKPLLARRQRLREQASARSKIDNASALLARYTTLLEQMLNGVDRVRRPVSVVGSGVGEAVLRYGGESRHLFRGCGGVGRWACLGLMRQEMV